MTSRPLSALGALALGCAALAGCSSGVAVPGETEYSCAGRPDGVVCRSTREIYALTDTRDHVHEDDLAAPVSPGAGGAAVAVSPAGAPSASAAPREGVLAAAAPAPAPAPVADPRAFALASVAGPTRRDARVVRIWIAPWQDQHGDLRMPGHIYAEVSPRSWSLGAAPPVAEASNLLMTPEMIQARDGEAPTAGAPLTLPAAQPARPVPPAGGPQPGRPRTIEVRS